MDDISLVAATGASAVVAVILWWAYGRYHSRLQRALLSLGAVLVGFVVYVALGIVFVVMRPDIARATGAALGNGIKTLVVMLVVVQVVIVAVRKPGKGNTPAK